MGMFTRSPPRPARVEPTLSAPAETRAAPGRHDASWAVAGGPLGGGGAGRVASHSAENVGSITAAIGLLAGTVGSLPASLTMDGPDGRSPAPATASAWRIIARPNVWQAWPAFAEWLTASVLLHGNGLAWIVRDGRGAPVSLIPVSWTWVMPQVIRGAAGPRLAYDVMTGNPETELLGLPSRLLDADVLHVRGRSDTGIIGRSVLSRAASVVAEARTLNTLAQANWSNGMRPSGYFSTPGFLTPANRILANEAAARYSGPSATGRTPIMEGGFSFNALSFSSVDAEMLASRRLSTTEIAALFNIPAAMLGGDGAGTGSDLLLASFAQLALTPIVTALEAEVDNSVLPSGMHLALDMGGLLRGNYAAVAASQAVLVQSGICRPNDARRILSLPAVPEGDVLRANGAAPSFPADAAGVPSLSPKPGPGGVLPNVGTNQNEGAG